MKNRKLSFPIILWVLGYALSLAACQAAPAAQSPAGTGTPVQVDGGSFTNLTPAELNAMLQKKDFVLVNVHIPFEGNLPATDISLPYDTITQNLDKLPADKTAKIVLYCRSGNMSNIAIRQLVKLGYTNLWQLDGGMNAWKAAGFTILSP